MQIINTSEHIPPEAQGAVLAIGNFDGVHLGHQAVIGVAGRLSRDLKLKLAVLTFDPHPRKFFKPNDPPFLLTPGAAKARLLSILNVDYMFIQNFSKPFSLKTGGAFARELLAGKLKASHIVVGEQFQFGNDRTGDVGLLQHKAADLGFQVTAVRATRDTAGQLYSSSHIREVLKKGDVKQATRLLGRPWEVSGTVIEGKQQARQMGYPTANFTLGDYFRPHYGIYVARVGVGEGANTDWYNGIANFGIRPTLDGSSEQLEAHLFDFDQDLYGQNIRVQLIDFIRAEKKFGDAASLQAYIDQDVQKARDFFAEKP